MWGEAIRVFMMYGLPQAVQETEKGTEEIKNEEKIWDGHR